jgi:formate hydrogenlyase subunit 3/multisubunit Na+/H+ antiporter MnhD subunit
MQTFSQRLAWGLFAAVAESREFLVFSAERSSRLLSEVSMFWGFFLGGGFLNSALFPSHTWKTPRQPINSAPCSADLLTDTTTIL